METKSKILQEISKSNSCQSVDTLYMLARDMLNEGLSGDVDLKDAAWLTSRVIAYAQHLRWFRQDPSGRVYALREYANELRTALLGQHQ